VFPLAYLITLRSYGTWLPGDPRGFVDRTHRGYRTPMAGPRPALERVMRAAQRDPPVALEPTGRAVVAEAIRQHCGHRGWSLRALDVRSEHLHVVVAASGAPERVAIELKAWSTRRLVERGLFEQGRRVWGRGASTRYLWTLDAVEAACRYVCEGRGGPLGAG
jgi:REP element-mobilizing transposase RayT